MLRIVWLFAGYFCGLFHTSIVLGKLFHFDVRSQGSGNAGTTNTLRTQGWKMGFAVLFGDILKGIVPMLLMAYLFKDSGFSPVLVKAYTGLGAILGHNYPFYTGFRGGKGIATSVGVCFGFHPLIGLFSMIVFSAVFFTSHYASVASLVMMTLTYGMMIVLPYVTQNSVLSVPEPAQRIEISVIFGLVIFLAFFRHRPNIARLMRHEESKTYLSGKHKKKPEESEPS